MDRGAWWAAVHGVAKSQTLLSVFTFTFHLHALEKEMAAHSSALAQRIPGTGEPCRLPSMGLHRVGHDWSDLAAADGGGEVCPLLLPALCVWNYLVERDTSWFLSQAFQAHDETFLSVWSCLISWDGPCFCSPAFTLVRVARVYPTVIIFDGRTLTWRSASQERWYMLVVWKWTFPRHPFGNFLRFGGSVQVPCLLWTSRPGRRSLCTDGHGPLLSCGASVGNSSSATASRERLSGAEHRARRWHPLPLCGLLFFQSLLCQDAHQREQLPFISSLMMTQYYVFIIPCEKVKVKTYVT